MMNNMDIELIPKLIKDIQFGLKVVVDGKLGVKTRQAIYSYQLSNMLVADSKITRALIDHMGILDTDNRNKNIMHMGNIIIEKHYMPNDEYVSYQNIPGYKNDYLFLHHTAGWDNPFNIINGWANDKRGKVGTEFVIGGQNYKTGTDKYDGTILKAFPENCNAWHLGAVNSDYMKRHSVGVELCSFGQLDGNYKNYINLLAHDSQIVTLKESFRGYKNWHKYSDKQLYALKNLILYVADRDGIDIRKGLIETLHSKGVSEAFAFNQDTCDGKVKGLLLHGNVRKDKFDLFPQPELIDMLLSL